MLKLLSRKTARKANDQQFEADAHVLVRALEDIALNSRTGCLTVRGVAGSRAHIYAFDGELYAVELDGYQPPVDCRLRSGGHLVAALLDELVMEEPGSPAQRARTAATRGWVSIEDLGRVHHEFMLAAFGAVQQTEVTSTSFADGAATGEVCAVPTPIDVLLEATAIRQTRMANDWAHVTDDLLVEECVLQPTALQLPEDCQLPEFMALLAELDGEQSLGKVAYKCGYTLAETVHLVSALKVRGLLTIGASAVASEELLVPEFFPRFSGAHAVQAPEGAGLMDTNSAVNLDLDLDLGRTQDIGAAAVEALLEELSRAQAHVEFVRAQLERSDAVRTDA